MMEHNPGWRLLTEAEALIRDSEFADRAALESADRLHKLMNLPARFIDAEFGVFARPSAAETACSRYLGDGLALGQCLILWGPNGAAKTWAACAMMNELMAAEECEPVPAPKVPRFLSWTTPMIGEEADLWLRQAKQRRLTVLDELGRQYLGKDEHSFAVARVFEVLAHRYAEVLPTVLTTNMTPDTVGETFGSAIKSRLDSDWAVWRKCDDRDFRREQADRG
jgi:DNA replication protein DnaC